MSKPAARLLAALVGPNSACIPDPCRDGFVIAAAGRQGLSLGRGSHPASALAELVGRDLVEPAAAASGRHVISDSGRAFSRRMEAAPETRFRDQHLQIEEAKLDGEGRVTINAGESPLAWLRRRRDASGQPLIDAASFEAGERLRRDLTLGGLLPSVTARWDGAIGAGGLRDPAAAADATIAARQRARSALAAVGGDVAGLLIDLCGYLKGLETIERERRWPARSGKVVVGLALARLAEHYGLRNVARGAAGRRGPQVWREDSPAA